MGCLSLTLLLPLLTAPVAQAGSWKFSVAGTMTASTNPASTPPTFTLPAPATGSLSLPAYSITKTVALPAGQHITMTADFSLPLTITATWVPNPQLPADPAPATLRVSEGGSATWQSGGFGLVPLDTSGSTASDGLGDACSGFFLSGTSSGSNHVRQVNVTGLTASWPITLSAHAALTATASASGGNPLVIASLDSYFVSAQASGSVKVDQDQQVLTPAATQHFSATLSGTSGFTVDWVKISVDGATPIAATMTPGNANNYYVNWPSSGALNPSEHTVEATAQIHDAKGTIPLDSTASLGNDRVADDIIAKLQVQSFQFNSPITLSKNDGTTVPVPQFVWNTSGNLTSNYSAAYLKGATPNFTFTLFPLTGSSVTTGFRLSLNATPNTTDPALTLYNNTANSSPEVFSGGFVSRSATANLYPYVAAYSPYIGSMTLCVKFQSTGNWVQVMNTIPGYLNNLYTLYDTPDVPMTQPWVGVLANACTWAKGDSTAAAVSSDLTKGLFFSGRFFYPGDTGTNWLDNLTKDFELSLFLSKPSPQKGNCLDVSDYLTICANAVGSNFVVNQFTYTYQVPVTGTFTSNPLCLIGNDPTLDSNYKPSTWSWHQIAFPLGSSSVYDVCGAQKLDLLGAGYRNPVIGWALTPYWQTNPSLGLVATPNPDQPVQTNVIGLPVGPYVPGIE